MYSKATVRYVGIGALKSAEEEQELLDAIPGSQTRAPATDGLEMRQ